MTLRNWLSIPLLFLLAILAAIVFKSLVLGIVVTVAYLFYMAFLPSEATRSHATLLPAAFVLITALTCLDDDTKSVKDITSVGFFVIAMFYTLGSFCILSPLKMLPINSALRFSMMFCIAWLFATVTLKSTQGITQLLENTALYFIYLSAVYGLSGLLHRKKALPNSNASI
jgi:hypothetical protein